MSGSAWFNIRHPRPSCLVRLVCLPWSGGGSQWFANWGQMTSKHIEVVGVTLPGRETRFSDAPLTSMEVLVDTVTAEIKKHLADKPIALLGHSMGVATSFEIARKMTSDPKVNLVHVFFSAQHSPQSQTRKQRLKDESMKWHLLNDEELVRKVKELGGVPERVVTNRDYMYNIFLPPFRADLQLSEDYWYDLDLDPRPLVCPVTLFDGEDDLEHDVEEFSQLTTGVCEKRTFPGGHFYLTNPETSKTVMAVIEEKLTASVHS